MVKVFFSKDPGFAYHSAIKELKKNLDSVSYSEIEKYDGYKDRVSTIVEACQSISLFGDKKTILVSNSYFFTDSKGRKGTIKESEQDYGALEDYLYNPSPDTDLYFVVNGDISKTGSPNKALASPAITLVSCDIPSDDDYIMLAYKVAKDENKDINREAAALLLERTKGDYLSFMNNLEKLFTYTSTVRKTDVEELVYKPLEDKVFSIVTNLIKGQTRDAFRTFSDVRKGGIDSLGLLPIFASQFNRMALIKYLSQKHMRNEEMASELGMKSGAIYYALKDIRNISFETLIDIMSDLSLIEKDIKLKNDDQNLRMELFVLTFERTYLRTRGRR